ncbi:MAG: carbohydrate kinase family protein [Eubacteriales bacterium]|nr:carbohydrate kinase family protein [Eubacteriales bacterium]
MKKVIVAGHTCVDITPAITQSKVERVEEFLTPGQLVNVGNAKIATGGAVPNTGLAMKVLGADAYLMGKIGKDAFGTIVYDIFAKYGAQQGLLIDEQVDTSYTIVLAIPGLDRMFLHYPGANETFCAEDVPEEGLKEAALFHFGYPPLLKRMYLNDGEELIRLLTRVMEAGAAVSLDLAAVDETSEAGKADWRKILERTLPLTDFFVPSVEELCYMLDPERLAEWKERAGNADITSVLDVEKDIRPLADECMRLGVKVLLIKCGAPGMYYRTAEKEVLDTISERLELDTAAWGSKEGFEKSFVPDRLRSATGAGDTSIAAFLTSMLNGETPETCVQLAAGTGACCVTEYDSLSGLKPLEELKERIRLGWKKVGE